MLAGNAAYDPSQFELIETITVGAGGAASVTFSNLNTYSTTYQHLQIRYMMRSSIQTNITFIRLNGDTGNNYSWHWMQANGSSVGSDSGTNSPYIFHYSTAANNETANYFSAAVTDILDPFETTKFTTTRTMFARPGDPYKEVGIASGLWRNTNALTSIQIYPNASNWVQGSRFSIYGLKN